nr:hypothetical protein [Wolbachia endosymbiont of Phyllotreta cruciferae]
MKSTKLERSRMRRKVSRTVLQSSEEGRPSSLRQQYADETSEEELEKIIGSDVIIKKAYEELNRFNWSEKEFIAYEQEIKRIRDERAVLEQKLDDAKKEGKIEIAKTMLANNVDVTTIVKFTGLSMSEIKELQN